MEEEKIKEEPVEEKPKEPEAVTMVEKATAAADRLEKVDVELKKDISKLENLQALQKLGGEMQKGQSLEEKKEETPKEYKDRIERGEF